MATRQSLHTLVDDVPEHLLPIAEVSLRRLGALRDEPFWRELAEAAESDEPLSAEDIAAIEAGWRAFAEGRGIDDEQLERLLA